jgi:hypothetical protein
MMAFRGHGIGALGQGGCGCGKQRQGYKQNRQDRSHAGSLRARPEWMAARRTNIRHADRFLLHASHFATKTNLTIPIHTYQILPLLHIARNSIPKYRFLSEPGLLL